jgi:hypothetical protein
VIVAGAAITELEGAVSDTETAQAEFVNAPAHKAKQNVVAVMARLIG